MARKKVEKVITTTTVTTTVTETVTPIITKKEKAYVAIVLDKSGSMMVAKEQTIRGFNEQVQAIKSSVKDHIETAVTLITFNGDVTPVFLNEDVSSLREMRSADYNPNGSTAMIDAVGYTIEQFEKLEDINGEDTSVLLIILSDGEENASKTDWKLNNKLAEKIQALEKTERWTFTYMGSNVDLSKVQASTGIKMGNMTTFNSSTAEGYSAGMKLSSDATTMYFSSRNVGVKSVDTFYSGGTQESK